MFIYSTEVSKIQNYKRPLRAASVTHRYSFEIYYP